jgi:uncharacterized membrane protein YphA (DoxX/SURF4 family)
MKIQHFDWATFTIRMVLGLIFFVHGLQKVKRLEETLHHFHVNLGLPVFLTYVVIFIEVIGGAFIILGFFTRIASLGIAFVMLGAICIVKWEKGLINGYEFNLALLAMALSLIFRKANES